MKLEFDRRTFLKKAAALLTLPVFGKTSALFAQTLTQGAADINEQNRVPVLLYHDISDHFSDAYTVAATQFASQMEWLFSSGYQTISLRRLNDSPLPEKAVIITFDDGYASFMDFAFPLLQYYHFKATINIIGSIAGSYLSLSGNRPMLSWDEYRHLVAAGTVDLGCHTYNLHFFRHRGAMDVPEEKLSEDLKLFQQTMIREIGKPAEILAWPYGFYTRNTINVAVKAGFRYMLTSNRGFFDRKSSVTEIPRIPVGGDMDFRTFTALLGRA